MADTHGYNEVVFGLFALLGYRFSPRLADLADQRFWRLSKEDDYGPLNELSRHVINSPLIADHWEDMLRLAGSLKPGWVKATAVMRTLQRAGSLSGLGRAVAELGRAEKIRYSLAYVQDETYRRRILVQLNRDEGHDPYHVGSRRGTGVRAGGRLYVSRNFSSYKIRALGPIRTVFELSYAPWDTNGQQVTEKKLISLNLGSNMTRYEEHIGADKPLPNCTIGLTLHEAKGQVRADRAAGWFRYWEPTDDSNLNTGVVVAPSYLTDYQDYRSLEKDSNQPHMITKPEQGTVIFYAGFGWQKSGQYASAAAQ